MWPFRPKPLSEEERGVIRVALLQVKFGSSGTEPNVAYRYVRLALRHGLVTDGTAGLPFYRITRKGERFLEENQ